MPSFEQIRIGELNGTKVLVTGGSTGIGAAVVRAFAAQGAYVVAHYNESEAAAQALRAECPQQIRLVRGDMSEAGCAAHVVKAAADMLGGLDGLVNNAGGMLGRIKTTEMPEGHFDRVVSLNARSVWDATRAAHPFLKETRGYVINTSSVAARTGGGAGAVLYAAAKSFVSSLTRGHAKEFVQDGIRVNAVAPGLIQTPFHDKYTPPDVQAAQTASVPMGRAGLPEECVGAFLFLASPAMSGYITGQVIEVNGGQLMP
ncbi:SDR family oxidoreductase [Trinickia caryophylli]|uniref:3-oxoacyl-[acyl-carrier protein] reductase n=1 Tax=Trinickia caryophylli TaxID=28094 RepID=A0A1X7DCX5_TRICW|nr:SDR family oxidoreductase [Trinickia caryophylli]PMS09825.1 KR domain-containing protein [Trinickia caryophylli]TRX16821.1 SDR family oxidoreductase [Trinickia caryophylli]WQE12453.1 SDR family oxidoreductase [Trinickia caryophylli]SMF13157.1 3-oxoacyl-[acyl-carrier protein] reductase [Trinickia caryophylli]GLU31399.1 oxidoreductase [Trinickia caryophylli]